MQDDNVFHTLYPDYNALIGLLFLSGHSATEQIKDVGDAEVYVH